MGLHQREVLRACDSRHTQKQIRQTLRVSRLVCPGPGADVSSGSVSKRGTGSVRVLAVSKSKCAKGTSLGSASYTAGAELTLSGGAFGADLATLQARLVGSGCAVGQALQSVTQNGTPTCVGPHAYASAAGIASNLQKDTSTVGATSRSSQSRLAALN